MGYRRRRYSSYADDDGRSCLLIIALLLISLIPAAIISVLGNVFLPQYHFTLLGGYAIVIALRCLKGFI